MFTAARAQVSQRHFFLFCLSSCRKCGTLTAGCTDPQSLLSEYLPLIWSIFGAAYTHTHTHYYHGNHHLAFFFPFSLFKKINKIQPLFFPLFNSISHLSFFSLSIPVIVNSASLSHTLTLSHASFFSLSLSLSGCLLRSLSLSVSPGAQLRVRSRLPHREGLRDNRGC